MSVAPTGLCGLDDQCRERVEAAGAGVGSGRIVAAGFGAGPDVHDFEGDELGGLDDEMPNACFEENLLRCAGEDLGGVVVVQVRPAAAEVEPVAVLHSGGAAGFEI